MPMDDMGIIYAVFTGSAIIEGDGKQSSLHLAAPMNPMRFFHLLAV
jgi:hypothetical protein